MVKRLLVTGATGFVGRWTLRHWRTLHPDTEVWATSNQPGCPAELAHEFRVLDLCDGQAARDFIQVCRPTQVIHLAGLIHQASLAEYLAVNVGGTENLYNALAALDVCEGVRIVQAGTAAVYGRVHPEELPVSEDCPLRPVTSYAISKMTQDCLAAMYWQTRGMRIVRTRIFNLLGPGQPEHLVPATFISQLRRLRDGDRLRVGNLAARRDFVDVRDVVRAFDRLLDKGQPGKAYNIASGRSVVVGDVLSELIDIGCLRDIRVEEEPARMRSCDVSEVYGNTSTIAADTGWKWRITLRESLRAMYSAK